MKYGFHYRQVDCFDLCIDDYIGQAIGCYFPWYKNLKGRPNPKNCSKDEDIEYYHDLFDTNSNKSVNFLFNRKKYAKSNVPLNVTLFNILQ